MCLLLAVYFSRLRAIRPRYRFSSVVTWGDHKWAGCTKWTREDMNDTKFNGPVLIPLHQIVPPGR